MNPLLLIVLGWIGVGLEMGLKSAFTFHFGSTVGAPSFAVPIVVLIAICAPPIPALWFAIAVGVLLDLTSPLLTTTSSAIFLVGPSSLSLILGAQFVLLVRGMVIRRHPLTMVILSVAASAISAICTVAIITIRHLILRDPIEWSATHELTSRLFSAVLTGGSALVLAILLLPLSPLLGLTAAHARIRTRR